MDESITQLIGDVTQEEGEKASAKDDEELSVDAE